MKATSRFPVSLCSLLLFSVAVSTSASASIWYVDAAADTGGDGTSWDNAFQAIEAAVDVAVAGDTIIVGPGTYSPGEQLILGVGVVLTSKDPWNPATVATTVIEGTWIHRVFSFTGFTVVRGGIRCHNTAIAVTNNIIRNGQGIMLYDSSPLVQGNRILENSGDAGAGISCLFRSSPRITNNIICGNRADSYGGGIYCDWVSHPSVTNNTILGNHAGRCGGGIYAEDGSLPTIRNCIIWDNGDDLFGCSATYSCISDGDPGEGNIAFYPHFVDPDGGDYRLLPWSPCINAGDPSSSFSLEPEPNGGRINMGAYGNTRFAESLGTGPGLDDLPDDWEIRHFGHVDYGGMDDPDGDGILNVDEYRFGWDPTVWSAAPIQNLTAGRCYELIQPAIATASAGDRIVVQPGRYLKNVDFLGKAVTLRSMDPSDPAIVAATVLDGGGSRSVVSFTRNEGRDSVLSGFTITGGVATRGAGVFCEGSSPTISDNVISGNSTRGVPDAAGCGVYSHGGSPLLTRNVIEGNEGENYGSAVYAESGSPVIVGNVVRKGRGPRGGGICVLGCMSATIERNWVIGNRAYSGGGICVDAVRAYVGNNVIAGNEASTGGGISDRRRMVTTIVNNTIVGNSATPGYGGGIAHDKTDFVGTTIVANCILWGNEDDLYLFDARVCYSCIEDDDPGEGNIYVDPGFVDPENGDYRLRADSACRNAGNTAAVLNLRASRVDDAVLVSWPTGDDMDGNPRISGAAVDIGAYEYQEGPPSLDFILEYSSDLKSWGPAYVGPSSQWTDDDWKAIATRFYRVRTR